MGGRQSGPLALKEALRAQVAASPRCNLGTVAADLTGQLWREQLRAAGFDGPAPSAWLAEGLLQYLETTAAVSVLAALGGLAAPGSHLRLDVLSEDYLTSPWTEAYRRGLAGRGTPWVTYRVM